MTHTYKMKHNPQGMIYSLLTVESDGRMTLTFHGTDREICHEVTENADGWLCYPGGMFPGLESGKWQLTEADNEQRTTADCTDEEPIEQVAEVVVTTTEAQIAQMQAPCAERFTREDVPQPTPRPKRQRKPRKPMATASRRNVITESRYNDTTELKSDNGWLRSAGYLAAASVALLLIWETGLIIPLGLIGLATSGFLK